jgi:DNA-binding transcriptional regulator YiaG
MTNPFLRRPRRLPRDRDDEDFDAGEDDGMPRELLGTDEDVCGFIPHRRSMISDALWSAREHDLAREAEIDSSVEVLRRLLERHAAFARPGPPLRMAHEAAPGPAGQRPKITREEPPKLAAARKKARLPPLTGPEIRDIRERTGLSPRRFAQVLNLPATYVGRRECSPRPLTRGRLLELLHLIQQEPLDAENRLLALASLHSSADRCSGKSP